MKKKNRKFNTAYLFVLPYVFFFFLLIILPVLISGLLSFTYFNTIQFPKFVGLRHYINLFTVDNVFMQNAIPNTVKYALIVGPIGYMLAFFLAWVLAQLTHRVRTVLAIIIYSPSLTGFVMMTVVWRILFNGDNKGYLNYWLVNLGLIDKPVQWLQSPEFISVIMIFVGLWGAMGVGFLAMLAGILNVNKDLYEAAYVDGLKSRFQEIFYITIPSMKPQMLFGAVMAIVGTFNATGVAIALSGSNPPPQYAGWLIVDHMNYIGFTQKEMGYASAVSIVLLIIVFYASRLANALFGSKGE